MGSLTLLKVSGEEPPEEVVPHPETVRYVPGWGSLSATGSSTPCTAL